MIKHENIINQERLARLSALKMPDPISLRASLEVELRAKNILGTEGWINSAFQIDYKHSGINSLTYLQHPLRVAKIYLDNVVNPTKEGIILAIFHNALEASSLTQKHLEDLVGLRLAEDVKTLTVDRERQWDWSYKTFYYERISLAQPRVGQVKIIDKLDNLFTLCLNPDPQIRELYIIEIERWIIPLAKVLVPTIYELLTDLAAESRLKGYCPISNL